MSHDPSRGPVATATATLLSWLSGAGVPARLAPPGEAVPGEAVPSGTDHGGTVAGADGPGDGRAAVAVWPLGLVAEQAVRDSSGRGALRLRARYLLAPDGPAADRIGLLDQVLVASLAEAAVHVLVEPVPADVWRAFGLSPRVGLYAEVPARVHRSRPAPARVRVPMRIQDAPIRTLYGQVVGPDGVPVPGVRVVAAGTGATAYTDNRGRFRFPAFPAGQPTRLLLSGRGFDLVAEVTAATDETVVIHCDMEEV